MIPLLSPILVLVSILHSVAPARVFKTGMWTNEDAAINFKAYNEEFFDAKLPADTVVAFVRDLHDEKTGAPLMGLTVMGYPVRIYLSAKYQDNKVIWLETEEHEMCHEAVDISIKGPEFDEHGLRWTQCMLRLAQSGGFKNVW